METGWSTRKSTQGQRSQCEGVGGVSESSGCNAGESKEEMKPAKGMIKLVFLNADSIVNKIDLLQAHACELEPDILVVTESWTHGDITKAFLKLKGYELIGRCDRTDTLNGRGGGILLYSKLPNIYVNSVNKSEQIIHATISSEDKNSEDIQIHCIYRFPNSSEALTKEVIDYIKTIPRDSILVGDFNYPGVDWPTLSCTSQDSQVFLDAVNNSFLEQYVDFPTNFTPQPDGSITATCIDLVLCNEDSLIASVKPVGQLGASHHSIIQVEIIVPSRFNCTEELVPDYAKADFVLLREKLGEIEWDSFLEHCNTEDSWQLFKAKVSEVVDECIPKKLRRNNSKPLWMQRNVMRVIRKKKRLWKQYMLSQDYQAYLAYKQIQKAANTIVRKAKKNFVKKNPKAFYSYISNRCKVQSKVGPLKDENGHVQTDDRTQAKILNKQFSSAFTREDLSFVPVPVQMSDPALGPPLSTVDMTPEIVEDKMKVLKPGASGPDKIGPRLLCELSAQLLLANTIGQLVERV